MKEGIILSITVTKAEFINRMKKLGLDLEEFKILGEYKNMSTPILFEHTKCKRIIKSFKFITTPTDFLKSKHHCPNCGGKIVSNEHFKQLVHAVDNGEYDVLDNYENAFKKIRFFHKKCNSIFYMDANSFLSNGNRCTNPECYHKRMSKLMKKRALEHPEYFPEKNRRKTNETFLKEVYDQVKDEYTFLEEYKYNNVPILVRHNCEKCNNYVYKVSPVSFLSNKRRCPKCSKHIKVSKYELFIKDYFDKNNFDYETQVSFDDCRNKRNRLLFFDFKLNLEDGSFILLEYDGNQHKKGWKGNKQDLKNKKHNDQTKNNYCKKNNIELYRISFTKEKDIESFLQENFC